METKDIKEWRAQISRRAESLESAAIESANQALKALLLLNGGASVAILGFLASTFSMVPTDSRTSLLGELIESLRWFGAGAGFAVGASCVAYLVNLGYARGLANTKDVNSWKWAEWLNRAAVILAFGSLCLFWAGLLSIAQVYA